MHRIGMVGATRYLALAAALFGLAGRTVAPAAAATPNECVGDADGDGVVKINELIIAVNNALEGCPQPGGALGTRSFTIAPVSAALRTALFSSGLNGQNVASVIAGGPLQLVGGTPDANGVAPLSLGADAEFTVKIIDTSIVCFRLLAAGSSGSIDCDGGTAYDVEVTQDAGANTTETLETGLGTDAGAGAATLEVMQQSAQLPAGSNASACATATYDPPVQAVYTTAMATAIKGTLMLSQSGENFSCASFATTDGPGMLVSPSAANDPRAGGDVVNALRLADSPTAPAQ